MRKIFVYIKNIWSQSIRRQLMIGIISVHALMMTIFVYDLHNRDQTFLHSQSIEQAQSLANTLAANSVSWILANDIVGLEEILHSQSTYPDLLYAIVISPNGRILGHTDHTKAGLYLSDEISISLINSEKEQHILVDSTLLIDVVSPIFFNNQFIGWSRVGLGQEKIASVLNNIKNNGILYTFVAIFVGALFAYFMSKGITASLSHILGIAEGIKSGNFDLRSTLNRDDELGELSDAFNLMLNTIKSNKSKFQSILDHSPVLIYTTDLEGKYSFVNNNFQQLTPLIDKNFIGKSPSEFFSSDTAKMMKNHDNDAHDNPIKVEEIIRHTDGIDHTYFSIKFPLTNDKGKLTGIGSISTDITEQQKLEEVIRRTQKMDALGKLTGGIAHDFNNLLAVISGYSNLLELALSNESKLANYAHEISHAGIRGAKLTNKLLAFSSHRTSDVRPMIVSDLFDDMRNMLEKTLTSRIKLSFKFDDDIWPICVDSSEMEDSILNICINSMHAIPDTGMIDIAISNINLDETEAKSLQLNKGDFIKISLNDSGLGMSHETKEKIFDPFFSTKGNNGTGLGLSQVYGFIDRCGGSIEVNSVLESGTELILYLPRCKDEKAKKHNLNINKPYKNTSATETILVVDDEPALLSLAEEILLKQGYKLYLAENAKIALNILSEHSVDLLLTDIIMPQMNGYQLANIVKEKYPLVKILLMSGYTHTDDETTVDQILSENILRKPYHFQDLLKKITDLFKA